MAAAGATWRSWIAPVLVTPFTAWLVHRLGASKTCGWDYGSAIGPCRTLIQLSVLAGLGAGVLALVAARGFARGASRRGLLFGAIAVIAVVLAGVGGQQFGESSRGGRPEMADEMCSWARETVPACFAQLHGEAAADTMRRSQPTCLADDELTALYARCMKVTDCKQIIDCLSHP